MKHNSHVLLTCSLLAPVEVEAEATLTMSDSVVLPKNG
jgi:hypothetical protein